MQALGWLHIYCRPRTGWATHACLRPDALIYGLDDRIYLHRIVIESVVFSASARIRWPKKEPY